MSDFISPLSEPVIEKSYGLGEISATPQESNGQQPTSHGSYDFSDDGFSGGEDEFSFGFNDDLGDPINGGDDDSEGGLAPSEEASEISSEWTADLITSIIESEGSRLAYNQTKINEATVQAGENRGRFVEGTHSEVKALNKQNKKSISDLFKNQVEMIEKPLKEVLKSRNVKISPESALIGSVLFSAVVIFLEVRGIKKSNDELIQSIINKNS
jgi:hypothetical protein